MAIDRLPIVFVHGSGCNAAIWHHQIAHLGDKYSPLAIDLPGHGRAGGDARPDIEYYAEAVERFISENRAARPVLAGHSLGGGIVLTMALRDPTAYRGLVLVGTGARLRVLPALLQQIRTDFKAGLDLLEGMEWAPGAGAELKAEYRRQAEEAGSQVLWCDLAACDRFDAIGRLQSLAIPALAVVGAEDKLTPLRFAQYFEQNLPNCRLAVVPNAGHMVQVEQPVAFNQTIGEFLAGLQ